MKSEPDETASPGNNSIDLSSILPGNNSIFFFNYLVVMRQMSNLIDEIEIGTEYIEAKVSGSKTLIFLSFNHFISYFSSSSQFVLLTNVLKTLKSNFSNIFIHKKCMKAA